MMKTFLKIAGATTFVAGVYLYSRKQTPSEFVEQAKQTFNVKKAAVKDWQTAYGDFKKSLAHFQSQLPKAMEVIDDIQRDVDEASFQIQPRIEEINQIVNHLGEKA
jgi:predicted  nucleic acid-binding Zn-ribbon protein